MVKGQGPGQVVPIFSNELIESGTAAVAGVVDGLQMGVKPPTEPPRDEITPPDPSPKPKRTRPDVAARNAASAKTLKPLPPQLPPPTPEQLAEAQEEVDFDIGIETQMLDRRTNEGQLQQANIAAKSLHADGWPRTPVSKHTVYRSDAVGDRSPSAGCDYINTLPEFAKNRITLYVYRNWPILCLPKDIAHGVKIVLAELDEFTPEYVLNRFGSGEYRIMVNDQTDKSLRGKNTNTICSIYMSMRDLQTHPPVLSEWTTTPGPHVAWSDGQNKTYIHFLEQSRIPVPGSGVPTLENLSRLDSQQIESEREQNDMATATAVETLAENNNRLTDRLMEVTGRVATLPPPAPPADAGIGAAIAESMKAVTTLATEVIRNGNENRQAPPQQGLTMADIKDIVAMVHPAAPSDMGPMFQLFTAQINTLQQQNQELQRSLLEMRNQPQQQAPAAVVPAQSAADKVKEIVELRGLVQDLGGGGDDSPARRSNEPWWVPLAAQLVPHAPALLRGLGQILSGPVLPPMPQQQGPPPGWQPQMQQQFQPHSQAMPMTMPPASPFPQAQPQPNPTQPQTPTQLPAELTEQDLENPMIQQMIINRVMEQLGPPIVRYMNQNRHGGDLADMVIMSSGVDDYNKLVAFGKDGILSACRSHPITAGTAMASPQALEQFIDEFLAGPNADGDDGDEPEDGQAGSGAAELVQ